MRKDFFSDKGITLVVLIVTIIILIILSTVTISTLMGDNGLIAQAKKTKKDAENMVDSQDKNMNDVLSQYANEIESENEIPEVPFKPGPTPEPPSGGKEYTRAYGIIEIKWLQGTTNKVIEIPNAPKTKAISNGKMELVKFDESSKSWIPGTEYSYVKGKGIEDNNESKWANAKVTIDGVESYFVWIPRYAYRIIYFKDEVSKKDYKEGTITEEKAIEEGKIVGYSDSRGIVTAEGKKVDGVVSTTKEMVSKDYFMVHPAFMDGRETEFENGEWDKEIEGIWIGKYEVSHSDASGTTTGNSKTIKVQPGVNTWKDIKIGDAYTRSREYSGELESHMLKNSEWGAVAYLTESTYGRNGMEITKNKNSNFITGGGE